MSTSIYARRIANHQRPDGHWVTLDGRPPQSYSLFTSTAIAARAVALYMPPQLEDEKRSVLNSAAQWLGGHNPVSTEDATFQLLGLQWTAAPEGTLQGALNRLIQRQRENGSWSQLDGRQGDAYSTGQALTALAEAGYDTASSVYQRDLGFLLKEQHPDGSWKVRALQRFAADPCHLRRRSRNH